MNNGHLLGNFTEKLPLDRFGAYILLSFLKRRKTNTFELFWGKRRFEGDQEKGTRSSGFFSRHFHYTTRTMPNGGFRCG